MRDTSGKMYENKVRYVTQTNAKLRLKFLVYLSKMNESIVQFITISVGIAVWPDVTIITTFAGVAFVIDICKFVFVQNEHSNRH